MLEIQAEGRGNDNTTKMLEIQEEGRGIMQIPCKYI